MPLSNQPDIQQDCYVVLVSCFIEQLVVTRIVYEWSKCTAQYGMWVLVGGEFDPG